MFTDDYIRGDYEEIEVGFVDGLFEMFKLRELITKAKGQILAKEVHVTNLYNHRFLVLACSLPTSHSD